MAEVTARDLVRAYHLAMNQGRELEDLAEWYRLEAEQAFRDIGEMRDEGRRRAEAEHDRLLPKHLRAVDVRTNTFKAMADAKGDFQFYLATLANTYATMATMKYTKAAALLQDARRMSGR